MLNFHKELMLLRLIQDSKSIPHLESAVMLKFCKTLVLLYLAKDSMETAVHSSHKLQRATDMLSSSIKTACSTTVTGCKTTVTGCRTTVTGYSNIGEDCDNCRKGPGGSNVSPLLVAAQVVQLSRD